MAHDAFISYSHSADGELAPRVQDGLQRLAKPWWRRRSLHVFRDTTGLSANPGLWSSIESSMDDSDWFVFLASPESAASPWVDRELQHWLDTRGPDQVLPVLTDGTWVWDDEAGDFDLDASTAVPAALVGVFAEEPRHVDLSWARTEEQLDLRNGRFRDQVAELAAPMHGLAKDDLVGADVREHRRTLRAAWGAAAALLFLLLASAVGAVAAIRSADEAAAQRAEANRRASEAELARADATRSAAEARASAEDAEEQKTIAEDNEEIAKQRTAEAEASARTAAEAENEADAARVDAEASARAEAAAADLAEVRAREADQQAGIAREQTEIATTEAARADREKRAANRLAQQAAEAARREEVQRIDAEKSRDQAVAAEETAREAQADAVVQAEIASRERDSARIAEGKASMEALAAASRAQSGSDGALSLLLAVEAADAGARLPQPSGGSTAGAGARAEQVVADATGRRALFEAVVAAQGDTEAFRVDRYLSWPAGVKDPPAYVHLPTVSPDGRFLAAAEIPDSYRGTRGPVATRVFLWDLSVARPTVRILDSHEDVVSFLAFAGDGQTLVTQDAPFDENVAPTLHLWSTTEVSEPITREGLAYVPPGDDVVVIDAWADPEVEVFDAKDRTSIRVTSGHVAIDRNVGDRAGRPEPSYRDPFTPDGRSVYLNRNDDAALWDLDSGALITLPNPFGGTSRLPRMAPDGRTVVVVEDDVYLGFWEINRDGDALSLSYVDAWGPFDGAIESTRWSPSGTHLATFDRSGVVGMFDRSDATRSFAVPLGVRGDIQFVDDGLAFFTVPQRRPGTYRTLVLDPSGGAEEGITGFVRGEVLALDAERRMYVATDDQTMAVVGAPERLAPGDEDLMGRTVEADSVLTKVHSARRSPSGDRLAVSTTDGVRVYDLERPGPPTEVAAPSAGMLFTAFRGADLIGVGIGDTPTEWSLDLIGAGTSYGAVAVGGTVLADGTAVEPTAGRTAVQFRRLPDGTASRGPNLQTGDIVDHVIAGAGGGPFAINLRAGSSGAVVARADGGVIGRTPGQIVAVSRTGGHLVEILGGRRVRVLRTSDLRATGTVSLEGLPDDGIDAFADSLALSPDGLLLAATNGTGTTVVWTVATGEVVTAIPGRSVDDISFPLWGLSFSPDGTRLVVKTPSNDVRMYGVAPRPTWQQKASQQLPVEYGGRVTFDPSGSLVMIDGLALLDGRTLEPIAVLGSSPGAVTRFSSDGRWLTTVGIDQSDDPGPGPVTRWSVSVEELRSQACRIAGRALTPDEKDRYGIPSTSRGCG